MRRDAQVAAVEELLVADGDGYPLAEAEAEGEADAEVVTEASDDGWADITVWTDAPDVVGPQAAAPFQLLPPLRKPPEPEPEPELEAQSWADVLQEATGGRFCYWYRVSRHQNLYESAASAASPVVAGYGPIAGAGLRPMGLALVGSASTSPTTGHTSTSTSTSTSSARSGHSGHIAPGNPIVGQIQGGVHKGQLPPRVRW
jgi:hypothetical protein